MPDDAQFIVTKMWDDDEINGRIYLQLCNLFTDVLLSDKKDLFFKHAMSCMHKLSATKFHLENYRRQEKHQYKEATKLFKKNQNTTREAFELIFEFEAFLFQIKSSLDILVKLMIPILGKGIIKTATFGKKGDDLIKGLEQYKKKKDSNIEAAENIINILKYHKSNWLEKTIKFRDELNHYEALNDYKFMPRQLPTGEVIAEKPKFKGNNTLQYMDTVYSNNLILHQDFMVYSLSLIAPKAFILMPQDPKEAKKTYNHKSAEYVKFCWGMVTE